MHHLAEKGDGRATNEERAGSLPRCTGRSPSEDRRQKQHLGYTTASELGRIVCLPRRAETRMCHIAG